MVHGNLDKLTRFPEFRIERITSVKDKVSAFLKVLKCKLNLKIKPTLGSDGVIWDELTHEEENIIIIIPQTEICAKQQQLSKIEKFHRNICKNYLKSFFSSF